MFFVSLERCFEAVDLNNRFSNNSVASFKVLLVWKYTELTNASLENLKEIKY